MSEGNVAADQLRLFVERIERLEEEKQGIADALKVDDRFFKPTGIEWGEPVRNGLVVIEIGGGE